VVFMQGDDCPFSSLLVGKGCPTVSRDEKRTLFYAAAVWWPRFTKPSSLYFARAPLSAGGLMATGLCEEQPRPPPPGRHRPPRNSLKGRGGDGVDVRSQKGNKIFARFSVREGERQKERA